MYENKNMIFNWRIYLRSSQVLDSIDLVFGDDVMVEPNGRTIEHELFFDGRDLQQRMMVNESTLELFHSFRWYLIQLLEFKLEINKFSQILNGRMGWNKLELVS